MEFLFGSILMCLLAIWLLLPFAAIFYIFMHVTGRMKIVKSTQLQLKNEAKKPSELKDEIELKQAVKNEIPKSTVIEEKQKSKTTKIAKETKLNEPNKFDLFSANILLYIGSILVTFSVFVFVAFNWDTFGNAVRSILLIFFTLSFYISGIILTRFKAVKDAGITFISVASISLGFTGYGLWRFIFEGLDLFNFSTYWLVYSIGMIITYVITSYLFKIKKLFYLTLISVYSSAISFAFTFGFDDNLIISSIFGILNIGFFAYNFFVLKNRSVEIVSKGINFILNFVVISQVISFLIVTYNFTYTFDLAKIGFALLVPTSFNLVSIFIAKNYLEGLVEKIIFPIKLLLFLFSITFFFIEIGELNLIIISFSIYALFSSFISEFIFKDKKTEFFISTLLSWIVVSFISALILGNSSFDDFTEKSASIELLISGCFINLLTLTLPHILKKRINYTAAGLTYISFVGIAIYEIIISKYLDPQWVHHLYIQLSIVLLSLLAFLKTYKTKFERLVEPLFAVSFLLSLILIPSSGYMGILIGSSVVSIVIYTLAKTMNQENLKFLAIISNLAAYTAFIKFIDAELGIETYKDYIIGVAYLIPALIYALTYELNKLKEKISYTSIAGAIIFFVPAILLPMGEIDYFILSLTITLSYSVFALLRYKNAIFTYITYFLANFLVWTLNSKFDILFDYSFLNFALLNFGFAIIVYLKNNSKLTTHLAGLVTFGSIILGVFAWESISSIDTSHITALSNLILAVCMLLLYKKHHAIPNIAGFFLSIFYWNYLDQIERSPLTDHLTFLPIALWSGAVAIRYKLMKKENISKYLEYFTYIFYFSYTLIQSTWSGSDIWEISFGIYLIILAVGVLFAGIYRKNKILINTATVFIILELLVRLYIVLINTPWYIYVCLIGILVLFSAIFLLWKVNKDK